MPSPQKPARVTSVDEPLRVVNVTTEFPTDYQPGDDFTVWLKFNRNLDPYELRAANEERIIGQGVPMFYQTGISITVTELDQIDVNAVRRRIEKISDQGEDDRTRAHIRKQQIGSELESLKSQITAL